MEVNLDSNLKYTFIKFRIRFPKEFLKVHDNTGSQRAIDCSVVPLAEWWRFIYWGFALYSWLVEIYWGS